MKFTAGQVVVQLVPDSMRPSSMADVLDAIGGKPPLLTMVRKRKLRIIAEVFPDGSALWKRVENCGCLNGGEAYPADDIDGQIVEATEAEIAYAERANAESVTVPKDADLKRSTNSVMSKTF